MATSCWSASAADLTTTLSKNNNRTIVALNGEIVSGDVARFKDLLKTSTAAGRPVSALRLNAPGGSMSEGLALAGVIQRTKISTVIASGATCAGACFIPFIAGSQKYVSATAKVGVPGAAAKPGHEPAGKTAAVVLGERPPLVGHVKKLGLLDAIVSRMLATPADEMIWLSLDDLRAMGVTMTGTLAQLR